MCTTRRVEAIRKRLVTHGKESGLYLYRQLKAPWSSFLQPYSGTIWKAAWRSWRAGEEQIMFYLSLEKHSVLCIMWSPCWPHGDLLIFNQGLWLASQPLRSRQMLSVLLLPHHFPWFTARGRSSVPARLVYLFSFNTIYWRLIYMWRSEDIFQESVLSFYHVDPGKQTWVARSGGTHIYQVHHWHPQQGQNPEHREC